MKLIIQLATISCLIIILGATISQVSAQYGLHESATNAGLATSGTSADLPAQVGVIINGLLSMIGVVFLLYAVYGGFRMITSQGDPGKVVEGRKTIVYAAMGVIVVASAYAIANFILGAIGAT